MGSAWCVQFHPEITHDVIRSYVESRREIIANEGLDVNALLDGIRETDAGRELFRRFVAYAKERRLAR
jgi:GMP synthase-like glutamine amidotransferase